MHEPTGLSDYRDQVERLFDTDSSVIVSNSSIEHAEILVEALISNSRKSLIFFCERLKAALYQKNTIVAKLIEASKRGVSIRIISQNTPETNLLDILAPHLGGNANVEIRVCLESSVESTSDINFVVMDSKGFRYENDRDKHQALASANNQELAGKMTALFERMWATSAPLGTAQA